MLSCLASGRARNTVLVLQAQFDAALFNSVFGSVYDQRDTLLRTALLLKPGDIAGCVMLQTCVCRSLAIVCLILTVSPYRILLKISATVYWSF